MKKYLSFLYFFVIISLVGFLVACSDSNTTTNPGDNNTNPRIDSLSPNIGYIGFQVKIYGVNFGVQRGASIIKFGSEIIAEQNIKDWSDSLIIIVLPDNLTEGDTVDVIVQVDGVESNAKQFIILEKNANQPYISGLSKKIATVKETIAIFGKHFGKSQGSSWVEFNGVKATSYPIWEDNKIIALIPEGATTGDVVVWVSGVPSNAVNLEIQATFKLLKMVDIKAGTFMMGDDNNSEMDNKPAHSVTISKDFLMSETEITIKQWKTVMDNSNPSHPPDTLDTQPVQQVSFVRACEFCNRLSKLEDYTPVYTINGDEVTWNANADGYRLPTEAEWEYACRGGRTEDFSYDDIVNIAWFSDNAGGHTHEVGQRAANGFDLYDMLGNVAEWCWDYYDSDYYSKSPATDPHGPSTSDVGDRIIRGGSFVNGSTKVNSSIRNSFPGRNSNYNYNLGFRVVRNK